MNHHKTVLITNLLTNDIQLKQFYFLDLLTLIVKLLIEE